MERKAQGELSSVWNTALNEEEEFDWLFIAATCYFSRGTTTEISVFNFLYHPCILNVTVYILLRIATLTVYIINPINQQG